ncbi:hypothetical protein AURANDRAFT_71007 [Aureococcus anophagefferens]|jgi:hypothetical protein|uniref:DUF4200 domain-containing protein n=2 Tax=Aureococcus anophagefferens TaxID=44056 RepID=F0Y2D2_AURAN|nr:hypothetical protein AURANDRAFT_71007 [Aureococcus anophagefferens]EGB11095.1 hypothetical protein AURANDRAFT_71007 [Aureococcus anophagefferens]|eukprot:XP_009034645.1 hypothetical protein AURANDRAFT_71007 [Aureococcus anophagefferens]
MDEERAERNPFTLPSDEEVFRMRDEERKRRSKEREEQRKLKVWQKTTGGSRVAGSVRLKELIGGDGREGAAASKSARQTKDAVNEARSIVVNERRQEKENMAEFIAKKREMFLVQMSLDTKREEIRKLEEKAQMKEEALKKSEQMLEEDAIRFDTFLKENDKKAHEAIKKAEKETKLKTDKVQEIKRLNQQIQMVSSDMSKHKEALEDCLKYKEFLDSLTPDEWFSEQKAIKRERQESRRQARIQKRRDALEKKRREAYEAQLRLEEAEAAPKKKYGAGRRRKSVAGADPSKAVAPKMPPPVATPELEDEPLTSSDEELPMYFKHPQQLLDIFSQLEEQNLFLIQNSQETEKALEELKQNFEATKEQMDGKTALLKQNIDELELQIGAEENKAAQLRGRLQARAGETQGRQEKLLAQLHEKVRDVYQKCGFDVGSKPSTLFMLSELEARLEQLLDHIETMSEEYIMKEEKDKEKKRRERKRQEQQALQDAQQEERNRKSIARSMQAPKKRTGRQVMFRSAPMRQAVREEKEEEEDDLDELKYLT